MADEIPDDAFLNAENLATQVAAELERLAKTLKSYQASADALITSAGTLTTLSTSQREATSALNELISELRRLGVEDTQRRLETLAASVERIGAGIEDLRSGQRAIRSELDRQNTQAEATGKAVGAINKLVWSALGLGLVGLTVLIWSVTVR